MKRLAEQVQEEGWQPDQVKFWSDTVRVTSGYTAILFIHVLRFDLALYLKELLEGSREFTVTLGWRRATLPSITEVGMAALLPAAERGLALGIEEQLSLSIGSENLTGCNRRQDYLKKALGRSGRVMDLEEAESLPNLPSGTSGLCFRAAFALIQSARGM
ncbi:MAG: PglZ domain-containing protein [Desulfotomaculales bacterium]